MHYKEQKDDKYIKHGNVWVVRLSVLEQASTNTAKRSEATKFGVNRVKHNKGGSKEAI